MVPDFSLTLQGNAMFGSISLSSIDVNGSLTYQIDLGSLGYKFSGVAEIDGKKFSISGTWGGTGLQAEFVCDSVKVMLHVIMNDQNVTIAMNVTDRNGYRELGSLNLVCGMGMVMASGSIGRLSGTFSLTGTADGFVTDLTVRDNGRMKLYAQPVLQASATLTGTTLTATCSTENTNDSLWVNWAGGSVMMQASKTDKQSGNTTALTVSAMQMNGQLNVTAGVTGQGINPVSFSTNLYWNDKYGADVTLS